MTFSDFESGASPLPEGVLNAFPCTLAQERIWAASKRAGAQALNLAMRWLVHGRLPHAVVEEALNTLVRRHEILRTGFRELDGKLAQIIWPDTQLKVREIDLVFMSEQEKLARAEDIARAEASQAMDPRTAPLLRATVLRFGAERSALLLTLHSIIADGWSVGVLIREFQAAATALARGEAPQLPALELQFADYALWQKELLASAALDGARTYWRRQLRRAVPTQVAPDRPRAGQSMGRSEIRSQLLPGALSQAAEAFARDHGVTLYGLAASALAAMLRRVSGERRIVIGSQVANREDPLAEALVGPIVNSITLCFDVDDALAKSEFIKRSTESIRAALEHQSLPAEAACAGRPPHSINLVVQHAYSDVSEGQSDAQPFKLIAVPSLAIGALWDLNFFMIRRAEGWRISCEANADLYDGATVDLLLAHWRCSMEALIRAPGERLGDCGTLRQIPARAPQARSPLATPSPGYSGRKLRREITPVEPSRLVVRFNEAGARTPVIALNNRSVYYPLAQKLGAERPFIDIQLYHPDGPFDLPRRAFEDFAADAVQLIRWAQPKGPYILCGHCVFGSLAFEAARQLQREGEEISLVAVFDTWAPAYRETMPWHDRQLRRLQLRINAYANRVRQFGRGEIGVREIVWLPILRRLGMGPKLPPKIPLPGSWFDKHLQTSFVEYRPNPYDGDLLVIRSQEAMRGRLFDARMGWAPLVAGELRNVDVRGMHLDMFRPPFVDDVAAAMLAFLADVEGR